MPPKVLKKTPRVDLRSHVLLSVQAAAEAGFEPLSRGQLHAILVGPARADEMRAAELAKAVQHRPVRVTSGAILQEAARLIEASAIVREERAYAAALVSRALDQLLVEGFLIQTGPATYLRSPLQGSPLALRMEVVTSGVRGRPTRESNKGSGAVAEFVRTSQLTFVEDGRLKKFIAPTYHTRLTSLAVLIGWTQGEKWPEPVAEQLTKSKGRRGYGPILVAFNRGSMPEAPYFRPGPKSSRQAGRGRAARSPP